MKSHASIVLVVLTITGCAGIPSISGCDIDASRQFFDLDPGSLALQVASPIYSDSKAPFLLLGPVGSHPGMRVDLLPIVAEELDPVETTECRSAEIRTFRLQVSKAEWVPYWQESRSLRKFRAGIGVPGLTEKTRVDEVGFAAVGKESGVVEFACGCLKGG